MRVRAALWMAACLAISPVLAQNVKRAAPAEAQVIAGAYELSNDAGTRKCIVLLRPGEAGSGYVLGFPPQCRMALPLLAKVTSWTVETLHQAPRARITLLDSAGQPQLDFKTEAANGAVQATDSAGQTYLLRPSQGPSLASRVDSVTAARPAPRAVFVPPPPDPAAMSRATGAYALIRAGDKDTGCRIRLDGASATSADGSLAMISACVDKGIRFFAPKTWMIAGETLWLVGARGRIGFERNKKGGWDKAPGQGEALSLVRN